VYPPAGMPPEVSFVLPCLDEAEALQACIDEIRECIASHALDAEIVVADNGSQDDSRGIASRAGARVIAVAERGYGHALMGGFDAAGGRFLVMGDADGSYDFREAAPMIEGLRAGADLVMGSRLRGRIEPGAMPWLHRWIGNPLLSFLGRLLFVSTVSDFHCGLRALRKDVYEGLNLRTTGMEFATEMVVKASARGLRIAEVPVTLRPDARSRPPHLRTWRDGWRHLRFMMVLSPRWTLFLPGLVLFALGSVLLAAVSWRPLRIGPATFDVNTMMIASLLVTVGYQAVSIAVAARIYAVAEALGPPAPWMQRAFGVFTLERGILGGIALVALGLTLIGRTAWSWASSGFPPLDPLVTLRTVVPGATVATLGVQTLLMSFVYSMLGIQRKRGD
jgi:glycosyltransferase involved in cell wall biosynthesis